MHHFDDDTECFRPSVLLAYVDVTTLGSGVSP